jgi:hypothetical protein
MDAVASSNATAIAGDRSGEGPLVILVGGAFQRRAIEAATAQLAGHVIVVRDDRRGRGDRAPSAAKGEVEGFDALIDGAGGMVLVFSVWPVRVLAVAGPLNTRMRLDEPGLAMDDSRPGLPEGYVTRLAGPVSAGRRDAVEEVETSAVGLPSEAAAPTVSRNLFRREGEYWTLCYEGAVVRLRDAKGLRHLARLLTQPGREFHAVDLEAAHQRPAVAAVGPGGPAGGAELGVRPDLGDAGELLDATAKAAYQARLVELRAELEEAEGLNDPARATQARQELEFLVAELARAVGLGGRDRRAASHAERARLNATRAIRAAMANLARANPPLGRHLAATIRTGRYCAYNSRPARPDRLEVLTRAPAPGREQPCTPLERPQRRTT